MVTKRYTVANMAELLDNVRPFTVGFDRFFDNLNNVADIANNYPPYNIVKEDEQHYTIEIACAGFRKDEFNIHIVSEGNKLIVQGVQNRGDDKRDYYHKGIGARNFTRSFALMNDVEVIGSTFVDGVLEIKLERIIPPEKKVKQITVQ